MSLRLRHSFELFPGARVNLGLHGASVSFGMPGATLNVGTRGIHSTLGIPGTGLSVVTRHSPFSQHSPSLERAPEVPLQTVVGMREIGSAPVEQLTSSGLLELQALIGKARAQHKEISADLLEARKLRDSEASELDRCRRSIFRWFYKRRIAELTCSLPELDAEIERLTTWLEATVINVSFETSPEAQAAYGALVRSFEALSQCSAVWDITADRDTNTVAERTTAKRSILRQRVSVGFSSTEIVGFQGRAMAFDNANGEKILIYPGLIIMPRADGAFALIDVREVDLASDMTRFHETGDVPADAAIVEQTWLMANKDGSRDLRFNNNRAIPVCLYGELVFSSGTGLREEYHFSRADVSAAFAKAFAAYKQALSAH